MSSLADYIQERQQNKSMLLMAHVLAGYPDLEANKTMLEELDEAGTDLVEIQLPFSEPIADGPAFVRANQSAIESGAPMDWDGFFDLFEWATRNCSFKVLMMGYYNSVFKMGHETFCARLAECGGAGFIIADLPPEMNNGLFGEAQAKDLAPILIMASDRSDTTKCLTRFQEIVPYADSFIYCVSRMGTTGKVTGEDDIQLSIKKAEAFRQFTDLPLALGFGLKTPEALAAIKDHYDIGIVGTALLETWERDGKTGYSRFVKDLNAACG
ncbi:MAG: tryptophan synthase subunit alpha, partial [Verrucomicrobiota bacterium]